MRRTLNSAIDSNRERVLDQNLAEQVAVHDRVDPSRPDRFVKAVEKCESFGFVELGDYMHVEITLKSLASLLQCPLTTIQIPHGWVRSTASTAKPVTIVDCGSAPSDFALYFVNDWDRRNRKYV